MDEIHRVVGFTLLGGFLVLLLWSVASTVRDRPPHDYFWSLLAGLQVLIAGQALLGVILFASGARPEGGGSWRHYMYGIGVPVVVLIVAHRAARTRFREVPWVPFGIGAFFISAGATMAIMTGLGVI